MVPALGIHRATERCRCKHFTMHSWLNVPWDVRRRQGLVLPGLGEWEVIQEGWLSRVPKPNEVLNTPVRWGRVLQSEGPAGAKV